MIILDTTVLVYAVGADHPLRDPRRRVLVAHGEGRIEATTTGRSGTGIDSFSSITLLSARSTPHSRASRSTGGSTRSCLLITATFTSRSFDGSTPSHPRWTA